MKITSKNISVPPSGDQHQNNDNQFIPMQTYGYANVSHSSSLSWYQSWYSCDDFQSRNPPTSLVPSYSNIYPNSIKLDVSTRVESTWIIWPFLHQRSLSKCKYRPILNFSRWWNFHRGTSRHRPDHSSSTISQSIYRKLWKSSQFHPQSKHVMAGNTGRGKWESLVPYSSSLILFFSPSCPNMLLTLDDVLKSLTFLVSYLFIPMYMRPSVSVMYL